MAERLDLQRELASLQAHLQALEGEYNAFFAGRVSRPPWGARARVAQLLKRLERVPMTNYGDRFRLSTLQARFEAYTVMWERHMRERDEGRPTVRTPGAPAAPLAAPAPPPPAERVLHVTTLRDPAAETAKLSDLYLQLVNARRQMGETAVSYPKFVELIERQVARFREGGSDEVAFRLTVRDGRTCFVARAVRSAKDEGKPEGGTDEAPGVRPGEGRTPDAGR